MSDRFEDDRGVIRDLLGPVDSITHITTAEGAVRGNHVHHRTTQWTYVTSGRLLIATAAAERIVGAGEMVIHLPGQPHAWKALEDAECLVFTRGPRSGDKYETDTHRLEKALL